VTENVRRAIVWPLRALLEDRRATGELIAEDADLAAVAFTGALNMAATSQIVTTGSLDADATTKGSSPS
jgi:hypothetical protein